MAYFVLSWKLVTSSRPLDTGPVLTSQRWAQEEGSWELSPSPLLPPHPTLWKVTKDLTLLLF